MKQRIKEKKRWKLKKVLRKSQPDFYRCVKKIEAQAKKCFSYKKTCMGNKAQCDTPIQRCSK